MVQHLINIPLPSPRGVALALMQAAQRDDASLPEMAQLIRTDPALAARLLQLANSAQAGGRPVVAISDAVGRLGLNTVRNVALAFSLIDQHSQGPCPGFDYPAFWRHSLWTALAMQKLTEATRAGSPEEMFSCGLLARIGALALATGHPQKYAEVLATGLTGSARLAFERQVVHTDEAALTAGLMSGWGFPAPLIEPIRYWAEDEGAQQPDDPRTQKLLRLMRMASAIAAFCDAHEDHRHSAIDALKLRAATLGLEHDALAHLVDDVSAQGRLFGPLLKIDVDAVPRFEDVWVSQPAPDTPPAPERMKVLVIEDDALIREVLSHWLGEVNGYQLQMATNGREGLERALAFRPQLVITDWLMPEMDGLGFCRALRASDWGRDIYVLMLTSVESEDDFVRAFDAGVDDFVSKPVNVRALDARMKAAWRYVSLREAWQSDQSKLVQALAELALINRKLEQTALSDELTDLPNRRAGMNVLAQVWSASQRTSDPLSVLAVDIDHFKSINDRYGHAVGDVVLRSVATTLREHARREDTVVRWGGEEFLVVMPMVRSPEAARAAERLRRAVQTVQAPLNGRQIGVTISVGVASADPSSNADVDKLLKAADDALYTAKHGGRNRVALAANRNAA